MRNLLTRNLEDLPERRFARMWSTLVDLGDQGYDIVAAYQAKELLRDLLALARTGTDRTQIASRLYAFYSWCAATDPPELHRLAGPSKPGGQPSPPPDEPAATSNRPSPPKVEDPVSPA